MGPVAASSTSQGPPAATDASGRSASPHALNVSTSATAVAPTETVRRIGPGYASRPIRPPHPSRAGAGDQSPPLGSDGGAVGEAQLREGAEDAVLVHPEADGAVAALEPGDLLVERVPGPGVELGHVVLH